MHKARLINNLKIFVVLWLVGAYLRLTILVIPPLSEEVNASFNLSASLLGSLTTLPVLMLALGAVLGSFVIIKLGPRLALALALPLVGLASAARAFSPSLSWLLIFSALMGLGVAVMQPALPVVLSRWLRPRYLALGSAVYMNGMLMGEFAAAGLTLPVVMPLVNNSWQMALLFWSLPSLLVTLLIFIPKQYTYLELTPKPKGSWMPNWKDPLIWRLGFMLAVSSSLYFAGNAYLVQLLTSRGDEHLIQQGFFWFNGAQLFASLAVLGMAKHWIAKKLPILLSLIGCLIFMLGMLLLPGWYGLLASTGLSFSAGILLILLVALAPQLRQGNEAGKLAAGAFTLSYSLSFFVPFVTSALAEKFNQPLLTLGLLLALCCLTLPLAWRLKLPSSNY